MLCDTPVVLHWFRRDLRLDDNAALYHALRSGYPVIPIFIFDRNILDDLEHRNDARVTFIHNTLLSLKKELESKGSTLLTFYNTPEEAFTFLTKHYTIKAVYTNHDYEPYAIHRDEEINKLLTSKNIPFHTFKDQCIFEKDEILSDGGTPYKVYTSYKNKWLKTVNDFYLKSYPCSQYESSFYKSPPAPIIGLEEMNFTRSTLLIPSTSVKQGVIKNYHNTRDIPAITDGTSRLGIHLRFGTICVREKARKARTLNETWLNEIIWRDFFMQLLWHFPAVVTEPFQSKFKWIPWRHDENDFQKWCEGKTGYPLVDAGMRELNATGHMHNRVRMVTASFLTKHLMIDWRWGEAYFASLLLDYDLSANNGNWQWSAGTGADAQPYFRIFNPENQQKRFDPEFVYIKRWVPEYGTASYPAPMIEHKFAVARCKKSFESGLHQSNEL